MRRKASAVVHRRKEYLARYYLKSNRGFMFWEGVHCLDCAISCTGSAVKLMRAVPDPIQNIARYEFDDPFGYEPRLICVKCGKLGLTY
jgi:hypothetical protein